jgi:hypothetical protein
VAAPPVDFERHLESRHELVPTSTGFVLAYVRRSARLAAGYGSAAGPIRAGPPNRTRTLRSSGIPSIPIEGSRVRRIQSAPAPSGDQHRLPRRMPACARAGSGNSAVSIRRGGDEVAASRTRSPRLVSTLPLSGMPNRERSRTRRCDPS